MHKGNSWKTFFFLLLFLMIWAKYFWKKGRKKEIKEKIISKKMWNKSKNINGINEKRSSNTRAKSFENIILMLPLSRMYMNDLSHSFSFQKYTLRKWKVWCRKKNCIELQCKRYIHSSVSDIHVYKIEMNWFSDSSVMGNKMQ